jgi:hypothetical protein
MIEQKTVVGKFFYNLIETHDLSFLFRFQPESSMDVLPSVDRQLKKIVYFSLISCIPLL